MVYYKNFYLVLSIIKNNGLVSFIYKNSLFVLKKNVYLPLM